MYEVVTFRSKLGHFIKNINLRAYVNPPSEFTSHTAAKASVINLSHFSIACVWQGNWGNKYLGDSCAAIILHSSMSVVFCYFFLRKT